MFNREHHQKIAELLAQLDSRFMLLSSCFFGGGTAISLQLDEFRESIDIDLICTSSEGYGAIRAEITNQSFGKLFRAPVTLMRDIRADFYGARSVIDVKGTPIKIEVVRQDTSFLIGENNPVLGVPTLNKSSLFVTKFLANADRYRDRSVHGRDIIDLVFMAAKWGPAPAQAWATAEKVYPRIVRPAYQNALSQLQDPDYRQACLNALKIDAAHDAMIARYARRELSRDHGGPSLT